jgi:hypothetical protein
MPKLTARPSPSNRIRVWTISSDNQRVKLAILIWVPFPTYETYTKKKLPPEICQANSKRLSEIKVIAGTSASWKITVITRAVDIRAHPTTKIVLMLSLKESVKNGPTIAPISPIPFIK